jgi:outer membrane protein assembly factor BamB
MSLRQRALSVALLVGSVNAACVNFRPAPVPLAASAAGDAPTPVWTSKAGRRFTGQVQVEDNVLYGGSIDRKVYAVDLASGDTRWSSRLPGMILGGVLLAGDTLFVASSRPQGRIQALDRAEGKQIWKTSVDPVGAPLAVIDGALIALTQRGEALGLDPQTGKIRWHRRVGVSRTAAVATGGGGALIATTDSLIRLDVADGRVTHRTTSPGTVVSAWLAHGGELLAGTTDSQLVSIRPSDLTVNWKLRVDAPVLDSPAALGDTLFLATRLGTVYRIPPGADPVAKPIASLHWPISAPVSVIGGQVLLGGADGMIRALRTNGSEIWRVQVWRPVELGPIPLPDGLIAVGGNGDLHRYRQ